MPRCSARGRALRRSSTSSVTSTSSTWVTWGTVNLDSTIFSAIRLRRPRRGMRRSVPGSTASPAVVGFAPSVPVGGATGAAAGVPAARATGVTAAAGGEVPGPATAGAARPVATSGVAACAPARAAA